MKTCAPRRNITLGRGLCTRLAVILALATTTLLPAPAAHAAPVFKAPFPCGQSWTASTYDGHGQSVDFNRYPGQSDLGQPALASAAGTARTFWDSYGGGNMVVIDHGGGWETRYAHLATVSISNPIETGEKIGTVGDTGSASTAPHLHYDQRLNGVGQPVAFDGNRIAIGRSYTASDPMTTSTNCGGGILRGSFDEGSSPAPGQLRVRGWAFDEDAKTTSINVHVYVGGPAGSSGAQGFDIGRASTSRPDVGRAYPGVGDNHGFDRTIDVGRFGAQPVYVYAINAPGTPGGNTLIGSKTVNIPQPNPFGSFDSLTTPAPARVRVRGWVADPSSPTTSIDVHVYSGKTYLGAARANGSRPDVNKVYPGYGDFHGFDATLVVPAGQHTICVYGINYGVGTTNPQLGCRNITVAPDQTPPETEITQGPFGAIPRSDVSFSFEANESASFKCRWDGEAWGACKSPAARTLPDGPHTFQVAATDASGNADSSPASREFVVDTVAPETTITSAATSQSGLTAILFSSSEPDSTFACQWDGGAWAPCSGSATAQLDAGPHVFAVQAIDLAGNADATPATSPVDVVAAIGGVAQGPSDQRLTLRVRAIKHRSKIRINAGPDTATHNYRFRVQRRVKGKWVTVERGRTKGSRDTAVVNPRRGKYRIVLPAQRGFRGARAVVRVRR